MQDAIGFARLLLSPDPERLALFDAAQASGETKRVTTGRNIGVRLLYWTAFVDGQGRVAFREDVYKRDAKLANALGISVNLPQVVADAPIDPDEVTAPPPYPKAARSISIWLCTGLAEVVAGSTYICRSRCSTRS
ncbi:hypothetical protein V8F63_09050 [Brevundimonas sp. LF-1]|uniref:hypothetical protein n=1 Tax=Brevundimonas sp. LF-1 TaxID=3126100 RepID=UPI0030DEAAD7